MNMIPHSLLSKAIVQIMGGSLLISTTISPLMAQELSKTDAASAAKTFATSTSGLLNDFGTRLDKLNNTTDANVQRLRQEMRGLQNQLGQMMALMAKTQKSAIEQTAKQTRQQIDNLKAKLAENSPVKEIINRMSQLENRFASITQDTSHEEVQKLEKQLKQVTQEFAEELRQQKDEITKATEKECLTQADKEQVNKALSAMESASNGNQQPIVRDLPPCLSPETQQKIQEYEVAQQERDLFMQQAQSMILMAMTTGNPYVIAIAVVLTIISSLFGDDGNGSNGDGDGDGSGNGKQSGGTAQTPNNTGNGGNVENPGKPSGPNKNGNDGDPTQTPSEPDGTVGNGKNGSGGPQSLFGTRTGGGCIIKADDTDENELSFIDKNNEDNFFIIEWDKINRSGDNPVPEAPKDIKNWSCDFKNESITVTYGSECRAIQPAEDGDSYDSISSYLGGLCKR